jgi:hypothetical protein
MGGRAGRRVGEQAGWIETGCWLCKQLVLLVLTCFDPTLHWAPASRLLLQG